jgi:hypothetical protein
MPIRNPFRRAGAAEVVDESQRSAAENGFKDTTVSGAKPLQVKDPAEYKLSGEAEPICAAVHCLLRCRIERIGRLQVETEINDSGVYLPVRHSPMPRYQMRADSRIAAPMIV